MATVVTMVTVVTMATVVTVVTMATVVTVVTAAAVMIALALMLMETSLVLVPNVFSTIFMSKTLLRTLILPRTSMPRDLSATTMSKFFKFVNLLIQQFISFALYIHNKLLHLSCMNFIFIHTKLLYHFSSNKIILL
ncbi:uncharacterized protein B0P05DRAFT_553391 [Gilbertella persicaria]|uniref:uncharacterized protein n=1 Tax=Gilbertella persicaria TaxID=101096 RepID=UPI00221F5661|nr:uncharacterized protein B0P05DRAFT_553391 [Gilbertella persicaria]KAI8066205.1 hypothetical protein B0P05DRAFT_553391 [Gilbertella persicaria]